MPDSLVVTPSAVIDDFSTWVLAVYPEDEQAIKGIPNTILEELYPDVRSLGPAMKRTNNFESIFTDLYNEGGIDLIIHLVLKVKGDKTKGDKGYMFFAVKRIDPILADNRDYWAKAFARGLGLDTWKLKELTTVISFLMSAYTVYAFPETSDKHKFLGAHSKAEVIIRSWEKAYADYCETTHCKEPSTV